MSKPIFDTTHIGCCFDCSRGIYIGVAVQELALEHGWEPDIENDDIESLPLQPEHLLYNDLITEAIDHLQTLTIDGLWWGYSESGDFGLWPVDCPDCNRWTRKHNIDCPTCLGTGNTLQIKL